MTSLCSLSTNNSGASMPTNMNNTRGYLLKLKSTASPFGDTNKRWFEIESSSTTKHELILSYYKKPPPLSPRAKNANRRGFIFISDIQKVEEDAVCQWITISHPRRTFCLQALDRKDHRKWFGELSRLADENAAAAATEDGDGKEPEPEQQFDDVAGSVNAKDVPSSSSSIVVSTTSHKLPYSTRTDDSNQSKASIEIDFLRRINQSTNDSPKTSPKMKRQMTMPRSDLKNSKRDTRLASRVGHAIREVGGNAKPRSTGASPGAGHSPSSPTKTKILLDNDDQAENPLCDQAESPLWQRHKNRMLLLDESSSASDCSSNESHPVRNDSLLTNKSFAVLEDCVSPTGLDKFISKTNRSFIVDSDAVSSSDEDSFGGVW